MRLGRTLVFVLAVGCPERRELPQPHADIAARADAGRADAGPVPLTIGRDHQLLHGVARLEDRQLIVRMTDTVGPCGVSLEQTSTASLSIELPPGPGGRFFAGAPVGVRAFGVADGSRFEYSAGEVVVAIQPFQPTVGARVRGVLDLPHGGGSFTAEVCAVASSIPSLPEVAPEQVAAGTLDGRTFAVRRGLIELDGREGEPARLDHLRLFQDEAVACNNFGSSRKPSLFLHSIGGTGSRRPLIGSPQPAWASASNLPIERASLVGRMPSWVRFDRLAFEPGAKVAGAIVIEQVVAGEPPTRIAGRFEAEICPR